MMIRRLMDWLRGRTTVAKNHQACVGVRNDGSIDLDLCGADEDDWSFHNLNVKDAEFIIEHLVTAIGQARLLAPPPDPDDFDTLQP